MASPFPPSVQAAALTLGVDVSSLGETEVILLQQILATETAIESGGGGSSGITALTGDVTASGTGSVVATLATVNANVGSFTNVNLTVDAKGRITAAASGSNAPTGSAGGDLASTYPNPTVRQITGFTGINVSTPGGVLQSIVITGASNTLALTVTGGSVTGSGTTSFASITGTWNTSGSPIASLVNIANTSSGANARLASWQVAGVEQVGAGADGTLYSQKGLVSEAGDQIALFDSGSGHYRYGGGTFGYNVGDGAFFSQSGSGIKIFSANSLQSSMYGHNGTNAAISWTSGTLVLTALPTSIAGLASGSLYTSAGVVMQAP